MRILKIFDGDYPWDVRVEKISRSLREAGHAVRIVSRNRQRRQQYEKLPDGTEIARLLAMSGPLSAPAFFNPVWWRAIAREIRDYCPDRLLVRDLPLAPVAVALGRRYSIPVIADLAEPYPDSLRALHRFERLSWAGRLARNPWVADRVERWVLNRVDKVIVVCPEAGQRLEARGLPRARWVEVGNTPVLARFNTHADAERPIAALKDRYVLFFSGLLSGDRGLDVALAALAVLEERHPGRFGLLIVGTGPAAERLRKQAHEHAVGSTVHFLGWVDQSRLPALIRGTNAGLLPFHSCAHINSTLANKLFEYMALGIPVVASDVPPMQRVLKETAAGVLFRSGDERDLARSIESLWLNPAFADACGKRGLEAVASRYHWDAEVPQLLRAIETPEAA